MRAGKDFLKISPADAAGVHTHQQLSLADFRHRDRLQANIIFAAINSSLHRPGGDALAFRGFGFDCRVHDLAFYFRELCFIQCNNFSCCRAAGQISL